MQASQLKPANFFAVQYGCKAICYGPPGSGKTPIVNSAPRPVLMITEPGMLSMRRSTVPTWAAFSASAIDEFFAWLLSSAEAKNFDTVAVDSVSQMAEIYLEDAKRKNSHGLKAYGVMQEKVWPHLSKLYFLQNKHAYLIAKQGSFGESPAVIRPYFPGKVLNIDVPHLYDLVTHCALTNVPGLGERVALRTRSTFDIMARDRSGQLDELEPPDLTAVFAKTMR